MGPVTHQTIKLSKGKHDSPEQGACVMELASMLAGEAFSDHPASVCPVIGAFLRAYNDSIGDHRRQDLYAYAAKVVGSRGSAGLEHARAEYVSAWVSLRERRRWRRFLPEVLRVPASQPAIAALGARAARAIYREGSRTHSEALALVDELLALGPRERARPGSAPPTAYSDSPPGPSHFAERADR
jgi:hypothetical protein